MRRWSALVVALAAVVMSSAPAVAAQPLGVVFVPANAGWVDTGIVVDSGEAITVQARGQALTGPLVFFPGARSGPDGQTTLCPDGPTEDCALDGAPYGMLVGRVGSGPGFPIGSSATVFLGGSGTLQLAVNDNIAFYDDNAGGYAVVIRPGS